jgi:acyl-homoserine lactone acylase PvdQ
MRHRSSDQRTQRTFILGLVGTLACGLLGASPNQVIDQQASYEAQVRRTEGGVPHIKASDFGSLGFGTGYSMAQDNICLFANQFLTFSAERSRFLGPQSGNLQSDFFYQLFIERREALEPSIPARPQCSAALQPVTTTTCARSAWQTSPTRVVVVKPGCARSQRSISDVSRE